MDDLNPLLTCPLVQLQFRCVSGGLQRHLRGLGGRRHHTELRAGRGQHPAGRQTGGHADRGPGGQGQLTH